MTKRELIEALEQLDCSDSTVVYWGYEGEGGTLSGEVILQTTPNYAKTKVQMISIEIDND
jgi:hypothetical protein